MAAQAMALIAKGMQLRGESKKIMVLSFKDQFTTGGENQNFDPRGKSPKSTLPWRWAKSNGFFDSEAKEPLKIIHQALLAQRTPPEPDQ
jgi:hypothetical protein